MQIQGRKLKSGKKPQKGVLNEFSDSRMILFWEQGTDDRVDVDYQLEESEKGYYSEEYRPDTIAKQGANVIDITAFIINGTKKTCRWKLYDVKKDVGGKDVVQHLVEQWKASYKYLKHSVLDFLDEEVSANGEIGVITRNFDSGRIEREIALLDEEIKKVENAEGKSYMLAFRKKEMEVLAMRKMRDFLKKVMQRKICFRDGGQEIELPFEVGVCEKRDGEGFYFHLIV